VSTLRSLLKGNIGKCLVWSVEEFQKPIKMKRGVNQLKSPVYCVPWHIETEPLPGKSNLVRQSLSEFIEIKAKGFHKGAGT
jgi:hypothetical protein